MRHRQWLRLPILPHCDQFSACDIADRPPLGNDQRPAITALDDRHRCFGRQASHNRVAGARLRLQLRCLSNFVVGHRGRNGRRIVLQNTRPLRQRIVCRDLHLRHLPLLEYLLTEIGYLRTTEGRELTQFDGAVVVTVRPIDGVEQLT